MFAQSPIKYCTAPKMNRNASSSQLSPENSVILVDNFVYYKKKLHVQLEMYQYCIKFYNNKFKLPHTRRTESFEEATSSQQVSPNLVLKLSDICGSALVTKKSDQNHRLITVLTIYAYVFNYNERNFNELKERKQIKIELVANFDVEDDENNLARMQLWVKQVDTLNQTYLLDSLIKHYQNLNKHEFNYDVCKKMCEQSFKPYLVFVNEKPMTSSNEKRIYSECVVPVWSEARQSEKCVMICKRGIYMFKINFKTSFIN